MAKQLYFPLFDKLRIKDFGGSLIKGNAREARPLSLKRPLHLVLRSTLATGALSFLNPERRKQIQDLIERSARFHGVKLYRYANSGNHLHLIILPKSRLAYRRFIRAISGRIARIVLGAERGRAKGIQFWDALPFTRILEWGKDFDRVKSYLKQNTLEALGFVPYRARSKSKLRARVAPS
jgi:REP element-mobilizing transposase RayT